MTIHHQQQSKLTHVYTLLHYLSRSLLYYYVLHVLKFYAPFFVCLYSIYLGLKRMLSAKKMAKRIKRRAMSIAAKKHLKPPPCPASPKSTAIEEESIDVS